MNWKYLRIVIMHKPGWSSIMKPAKAFMIGDDGEPMEVSKQGNESHHGQVVSRLLTKLGNEGWELVSTNIAEHEDPGGWVHSVLYFKKAQA